MHTTRHDSQRGPEPLFQSTAEACHRDIGREVVCQHVTVESGGINLTMNEKYQHKLIPSPSLRGHGLSE